MIKTKSITAFIAIFAMLFFSFSSFSGANSELREQKNNPFSINNFSEKFKPDEIVVKYKGDEKFRKIKLSAFDTVTAALQKYRNIPQVQYAEPNYIAHAFMVPNDNYYSYQWHLEQIAMEQAWDYSDGSGVTIAIIDTGIAYEDYREGWFNRYYQAPDLSNTHFVPGYDFVGDDTHANDDNGHGTHVAGTVAQSTNNNQGVAGVAYKAYLMPVKVLDSRGSGAYSDVADGIRWAADNGADVINLSLGGSASATYLQEAVQYAYQKGVTIIAAAGNDGHGQVSYPAAYDNYVIAVGATRYDKNLAPYSNYGSSIDVVAPGGDTSVDQNKDGYGDGVLQETFGNRTSDFGYYFYQGTSMASPHVAGVAALILSKGNASTPDEVRNILQSTAQDLGSAGRDDRYGYGLINAAAALRANVTPPQPNEAPIAYDQSITISEDSAISITLSAIDADDDSLVYSVITQPANGALSGSGANLTYAPDNNFNGSDSFTFKASDGKTDSNTATISITITAENDAPVVSDIPNISFVAGTADSSIDLDNYVNDPDNADSEIIWTFSGNTDIQISIDANNVLTFTASEDFIGQETITFTAADPSGLSDNDELTVNVLEKPVAPMAFTNIELTTSGWLRWRAHGQVQVLNDLGQPIENARVNVTWSGSYNKTEEGSTNSSGIVSFNTGRIKNAGQVTLTINSITKNGTAYELSGEISDSISGGSTASWFGF